MLFNGGRLMFNINILWVLDNKLKQPISDCARSNFELSDVLLQLWTSGVRIPWNPWNHADCGIMESFSMNLPLEFLLLV